MRATYVLTNFDGFFYDRLHDPQIHKESYKYTKTIWLYLDLDTVCTKSIDPIYNLLLKYDLVMYSNPVIIDIDFILCRPYNSVIRDVLGMLYGLKIEKLSSSFSIAYIVIPIINAVHDPNVKVLKEYELFNCSQCELSSCTGNLYITRIKDMSYATFFDKWGRKATCLIYNTFGKTSLYIGKKFFNVDTDYYHN